MTRLQVSDCACLAIVAYDLAAPPGQTISEAVDRYLDGRRWTTEAALALIYLHVSNRIPSRVDPIHLVFLGIKHVWRTLLSSV